MFLLKVMGFGFKMWYLFGFQISLRAELRKDIKRTAFEHASLGESRCAASFVSRTPTQPTNYTTSSQQ